MQTVIGSTGVIGTAVARALPNYTSKIRIIGTAVARALPNYTSKIRLVSRNPKKVNPGDETVSADVLDAASVARAVAGSEIVFLCVGLEYRTAVWERDWPKVMRNVLDACAQHKTKLVWFDNIYPLDPTKVSHMTEETPMNPSSRKGKVRAKIDQMLLDDVKAGKLQALVARAADFTATANSAISIAVLSNFLKGKPAQWIGDPSKKHNFTYHADAGRAVAELGNTADAYDQIWNLPSTPPMTGKQWIELAAKECGMDPGKFSALPRWSLLPLSAFVPYLGEVRELAYQFYGDYHLDSTKFERRFGWKATPPEEQIRGLVEEMRAAGKA
ncbi:NAD-dependent epimerase/dehydratase [Hyaloraphidium curvatum]|nr:NAD-dependent epimerase/dehydratase [Hyaloraphidium curvatum]